MEVLIEHKGRLLKVLTVVSLLLMLLTGHTFGSGLPLSMMMLLTIGLFITSVVLDSLNTMVSIEDETVRVKFPIGQQVFDLNDITGLRYGRSMMLHLPNKHPGSVVFEQRAWLEIRLRGRALPIRLTDFAGSEHTASIPDSDIPLHILYECLREVTGVD